MFELIICSMLTILPDYLYRRYVQGKRLGKEITFFSVWFELRYGIVACLMLTVSLITLIFYFHPSTSSATVFFRTVPITTETRNPGTGCGSQCRLQPGGEAGRRAVQAGQFKGASGSGNRQAQDRRG